MQEFEDDAVDNPELIALTNWDAIDRLQAMLGEEVEILATVGDIRQGDRGPKRVMLSRRMFMDFPLIFWEDDVFEDSGIGRYRGEYVRVRGVVTSYTDCRNGRVQLQLEVRDPAQVQIPTYVPPGDPGSFDEDSELENFDETEAVEEPEDSAACAEPRSRDEPRPGHVARPGDVARSYARSYARTTPEPTLEPAPEAAPLQPAPDAGPALEPS